MAKLDFPSSDQSPWTNPDNGITYVWKGGTQGAWHIASAGDTDIFVAKAGDKMTGDLTLGPEGDTNITLDATDGNGSFAGDVSIGSNFNTVQELVFSADQSKYGVQILEDGVIGIARVNDSCLILNQKGDTPAAYAVQILGDGVDAINLGADGSATFTGNVATPGVVFGTPSGDVTSKTLDDYEEGTFTPVFRAGGTTPKLTGISNETGTYTKIGNVVHVSVVFNGQGTGDFAVEDVISFLGLPFISAQGGAATAICQKDSDPTRGEAFFGGPYVISNIGVFGVITSLRGVNVPVNDSLLVFQGTYIV